MGLRVCPVVGPNAGLHTLSVTGIVVGIKRNGGVGWAQTHAAHIEIVFVVPGRADRVAGPVGPPRIRLCGRAVGNTLPICNIVEQGL